LKRRKKGKEEVEGKKRRKKKKRRGKGLGRVVEIITFNLFSNLTVGGIVEGFGEGG